MSENHAKQLVESGLDEDEVALEFAAEFGVEPSDIEYEIEVTDESDFGIDYWQVEVSGREYIAFEDWDDAYEYATQRIVQDFEDDPGMVAGVAEWAVKDNLEVYPGDVRLVAQDMADWAYDLDDDDAVERADMEDEYEEALEDENDMRASEIADNAREQIADEEQRRWEDGLKQDPLGFLTDEEGLYSTEDVLGGEVSFVHVDYEGLADDILKNDGIGPTLAGYDGEERETDSMVYFRQN